MKVSLHPLVLLNITDHSTRSKVNSGAKHPLRVFGALLLKSNVKNPELSNSFELTDGKKQSIDFPFLSQRLKAYQEVFPEVEFAGLYIADPNIDTFAVTKQDADLLAQLKDFSSGNAQFILKVDSSHSRLTKLGTHDPLPLGIFEIVKNHKGEVQFERQGHAFVSDEGERVGVSDAASLVPDSPEVSSFAANGSKTTGALQMLGDKIHRLCQILEDEKIMLKVDQNPRLARMLMHLWGQLKDTFIDNKLEKVIDKELLKVNLMTTSSIMMSGDKLVQACKLLRKASKMASMKSPLDVGAGHFFEDDDDDDRF